MAGTRHAIAALALKDLRLLLRDRAAALFVLCVPILYALFFGILFSGSDGGSAMNIAVVDEDGSDISARFVARLESAPELSVVRMTRAHAEAWVRRGDGTALLVLPSGFGQIGPQLLLGGQARIELGVDPVRRAEAGMLEGILHRYFFELLSRVAAQPEVVRPYVQGAQLLLAARSGLSPNGDGAPLGNLLGALDAFLATGVATSSNGETGEGTGEGTGGGSWMPLRVESLAIAEDTTGPTNAFEISFPQGLVWGLIACAATFATSLVNERVRGTLVRLRSAPIGRGHILLGKALACFIACAGTLAFILGLGAVAFGVRADSVVLLVLACLATAWAFTGMMMALSLLGRSERATSAIAWVSMMLLAMFGGGMMPLFFMPEWMQTVSHVSPVKWTILALEGALWRGFGLAEMALPLGVLLGVGAVALGLGLRLFRVTQEA